MGNLLNKHHELFEKPLLKTLSKGRGAITKKVVGLKNLNGRFLLKIEYMTLMI